MGAGVATAGGGLWEGPGGAFPRAGGGRGSQPLTSFGKSDIIGLSLIHLSGPPGPLSHT